MNDRDDNHDLAFGPGSFLSAVLKGVAQKCQLAEPERALTACRSDAENEEALARSDVNAGQRLGSSGGAARHQDAELCRLEHDDEPISDDDSFGIPEDDADSYPIDWDAASTPGNQRSTKSGEAQEEITADQEVMAELTARQLKERFRTMIHRRRIGQNRGYRLKKLLGSGGQGIVYLTKRDGADGFGYKAAVKVFSPESYPSVRKYEAAMRRIARVASQVAQAHHPNLVDVLFFEQRYGIRLMLMERVEGYDLRRLLKPEIHLKLQERASHALWDRINTDVVTAGDEQLRMQPGFAVAIVRDCLAGLFLLHGMQIVHGDIKPSNIMLTQIGGRAKLVDLGSAFDLRDSLRQRFFTPAYAAPEVLERRQWTPQSDLASLGYVLIELLSGRRLFKSDKTSLASLDKDQLDKDQLDRDQLLENKRALPDRLEELLPQNVQESKRLMGLCRGLVQPKPEDRFASAEEADLHPRYGASAFLRELVIGNLATVYDTWIRLWIEALR